MVALDTLPLPMEHQFDEFSAASHTAVSTEQGAALGISSA